MSDTSSTFEREVTIDLIVHSMGSLSDAHTEGTLAEPTARNLTWLSPKMMHRQTSAYDDPSVTHDCHEGHVQNTECFRSVEIVRARAPWGQADAVHAKLRSSQAPLLKLRPTWGCYLSLGTYICSRTIQNRYHGHCGRFPLSIRFDAINEHKKASNDKLT